jgi:CRP/FNR family cyclic AMP-dependent transcriptional regulator
MTLSRLTNIDPSGETAWETSFMADAFAEDWERIERHAARRRFAAGEHIVSEGELDRSLLIVLDGELEFVAAGADGSERMLSIISAPTLVGEVAFFDPGPRSGSLRARTAGELLRLSFEQFEALAASSPSLARTLLLEAGRILAIRLRRATSLLAE